jgi:outer membrane protein assembly factor BamB
MAASDEGLLLRSDAASFEQSRAGGFEANGIAVDGRAMSSRDGSLLVVDAATGATVPSVRVAIDGVVSAAAHRTLFLRTAKELSALDLHTGRTLWTARLRVRQLNGAMVAGSSLWVEGTEVASGRDRLWRLGTATGRTISSLALRDFGVAGMAQVGGRLWMLTPTGTLEVIR